MIELRNPAKPFCQSDTDETMISIEDSEEEDYHRAYAQWSSLTYPMSKTSYPKMSYPMNISNKHLWAVGKLAMPDD